MGEGQRLIILLGIKLVASTHIVATLRAHNAQVNFFSCGQAATKRKE
jgi:hypothetical protein